jgi:hypothetical protein
MGLSRLAPCLLVVLGGRVLAQEPEALATEKEKLDYLIQSWRGQSEESLKTVWGREESLTEQAGVKTYMFQRSKRGPALGLGGVQVLGRGQVVCSAYFQIGLENIVTRATWRGPSAGDCWDLLRENAPPAPE